MATTYLIDFENVRELGMIGIRSLQTEDRVYIIYTENAKRINLDCFNHICVPVSAIKVESGSQSLDMHLVSILGYLIGRENDPGEAYVIVSQDAHFVTVSNYWCNRFNDDNKVVVLPSICGAPISICENVTNQSNHDIAANRIDAIIRKHGVCGDYGRMLMTELPERNTIEYSRTCVSRNTPVIDDMRDGAAFWSCEIVIRSACLTKACGGKRVSFRISRFWPFFCVPHVGHSARGIALTGIMAVLHRRGIRVGNVYEKRL